MTLLEALPKNAAGRILLDPGAQCNGEDLPAEVDVNWFEQAFPVLAKAEVPLDPEHFAMLRGIDPFWARNAEKWRAAGLI